VVELVEEAGGNSRSKPYDVVIVAPDGPVSWRASTASPKASGRSSSNAAIGSGVCGRTPTTHSAKAP
jgi:hypothetical protein